MRSLLSVLIIRAHSVTRSIDVKGLLQHAISGEEIPGWYTANDLDLYIDVDMGDYVVYNDWIGQVKWHSFMFG